MMQVRSLLAVLAFFAGSAMSAIQSRSGGSQRASAAFVSSAAALRPGPAQSSVCRLASFTAARRQRVARISQRNAMPLRMGLNEELWHAAEYGFENEGE
eukprot:1826893-Rhodomonas_salina.2